MQKAWMRVLKVTLSTDPKDGFRNEMTFGANDESKQGFTNLNISITGNKYMSTLKDNCTVKISNLTYVQIIQIIQGKFFNIKIEAGYRSSAIMTIFDGGIIYISNLRESVETNTVTIFCASKLVAKQRSLNLSFNSGINLYSAISFVCKAGGVQNPIISTQFKKQFLTEILNCQNQPASAWLDVLTRKNGAYVTNSDNTADSFLLMYDGSKSDARRIVMNNENFVITNGFPRMTSEGVSFSILPTFALQCGDTLLMRNEDIQLEVSKSNAFKEVGAMLSSNGEYIIFEIGYTLQNRGHSFYFEILAKSKQYFYDLLGKK